MSGLQGGRSSVFNFTLTELAFLMLFIVLLLAAAEADQAMREGLRASRLQEQLHLKEAELEVAIEARKFEDDPEERFRHLVRQVAEANLRVHRLEEERQRAEGAASRAEELERRVARAERQVKFLSARVGPTGFGPPPCWLSEEGRIEYIYEITIHESYLEVRPAWPARREPELSAIPGARLLPSERLSLSEFRRQAEPIFAWSKQQEPECRHFVVIRDRATTKQAFKRSLLTVENYFYKYLSPQ